MQHQPAVKVDFAATESFQKAYPQEAHERQKEFNQPSWVKEVDEPKKEPLPNKPIVAAWVEPALNKNPLLDSPVPQNETFATGDLIAGAVLVGGVFLGGYLIWRYWWQTPVAIELPSPK